MKSYFKKWESFFKYCSMLISKSKINKGTYKLYFDQNNTYVNREGFKQIFNNEFRIVKIGDIAGAIYVLIFLFLHFPIFL